MKIETILLFIRLELAGCADESSQEQITAQQQPVCRQSITKMQGQIIECH